ncbi:hypothetical protein ABZZ92_25065 [Streptomyces ardesiacus]|uniref:hypothetical protein n=1 Tax=Streptomyces ardesiacus TaxID=285564 RepID=UPI000ADD7B7F|nr:hypothetical protein [Streptomyces sp. NBRC 110030]
MSPRNVKILWVLVAALASLVVALVAGILFSSTGVTIAEAVLYGGGVFGGSLVVSLAVLGAVGVLH